MAGRLRELEIMLNRLKFRRFFLRMALGRLKEVKFNFIYLRASLLHKVVLSNAEILLQAV